MLINKYMLPQKVLIAERPCVMTHLDLPQMLQELLGLLVLCTHLHHLHKNRQIAKLGCYSLHALEYCPEV